MELELEWSIGGRLPRDHGYYLFAALSHELPRSLHESDGWAIAPVTLDLPAAGLGRCTSASRLRVRCEAAIAGKLAGAIDFPGGLELERAGGLLVTFGPPRVAPILPGPTRTFRAALVTLKGALRQGRMMPRAEFRDGVLRYLRELEIETRHVEIEVGEAGEGRVSFDAYGGYAVTISGISRDRDARVLLGRGVGGRRKMGAGWFDPV